MTKDEMQLVIRAVDQASATMKAIQESIHQIGAGSEQTAKQVEGLGSKLSSFATSVKNGLGIGLGLDIIGGLQSAFQALVDLVPNAVRVGDDWARQVEQIRRETNMTAEQTSGLLAIFQQLNVPIDQSARVFAMFGKSLSSNIDLLNRLGVATKDSNGAQLDAFTIIDNLRHRFSEYGASLTETADAQKLLGRTGYELLPFLQMTDAQFRALSEDAAKSGLVLSDQALAGAHAFNLEMGSLGNTLEGLQTQIFSGLAPTLASFASAFKDFLQQHMQEIVAFVVNAANFVMGVVGGLFGIDFQAIKLSDVLKELASSAGEAGAKMPSIASGAKQAAVGEDALTRSIKAQIQAIDEQIKAIDQREARRHAATERVKLQAAIGSAQANLQNIQGNAPDVVGLSSAEAVLAMQKHNQDIVDAQKALNDALAALSTFDQDQHDSAEKAKLEATKTSLEQQLQAHHAAAAGHTAILQGLVGRSDQSWKTIAASVRGSFATMNASAMDWRDKGVAFAGSFKGAIDTVIDALLGAQVTTIVGPHDGTGAGGTVTTRSGGLIGALRGIADAFGWLENHAGTVALGFRAVSFAISSIGEVLNRAMQIVHDAMSFDFSQAQADIASLHDYLARGALSVWTGHAMGGFVPPGGVSRVGEVAAEAIYARPGGGVDVYSNPGAGRGSSGSAHGHDIYMDGYKVARAIDERFAHEHRSTTLRPIGAS